MSANGWRVADSDMHVMEPPDLWQRYIAPEWRTRRRSGSASCTATCGSASRTTASPRMGRGEAELRGDGRLEARIGRRARRRRSRALGTRVAARGHGRGGCRRRGAVPEPRALRPRARLHRPRRSRWARTGTRRRRSPVPTTTGWPTSAARARACLAPVSSHRTTSTPPSTRCTRCIESLGFTTVFMLPGLVNGRPWHDPATTRSGAACEQLGVPVCFHGGGQNYLRPDYTLEFDNLMMWHTFGQPIGIMAVTASITAGGVLQRFPDLRVGLLEGNCGWAPWMLDRLDEHWEWVGDKDAPELDRAPSEYFRSNCFLSIEADERPARVLRRLVRQRQPRVLDRLPARRLEVPRRRCRRSSKLPIDEDTKRKALWDNWCRLYGRSG